MIREIAYENREEWLKIRGGYIGGSDAGAVVGMNPFRTPFALWAEKTGKVPPFEGNITTRVGAHLEDLVADLFCEETGKKVQKKNRVIVNDEYPFACADIDRKVVGERALLEIKTTNSIPVMRRVRGGEYPETWYCQMVHYLAVTGFERAYLAVLINCRDFKVYTLERDEAEIKALMDAERTFFRYVETGTEPPTDGFSPTSEAVAAMFPESSGDGCVDLHPYDDDLDAFLSYGNQIKQLETLREEKANRIKCYMEDAPKGESDRYSVTWKQSVRLAFDAKKFIADHPDIDLDPYWQAIRTRAFKVRAVHPAKEQ